MKSDPRTPNQKKFDNYTKKKLNRVRGLSDWNNIKPIEIKAPTYFPTNERIEETPPPNFKKTVDPDLLRGLGSLLAATRKDYQK